MRQYAEIKARRKIEDDLNNSQLAFDARNSGLTGFGGDSDVMNSHGGLGSN